MERQEFSLYKKRLAGGEYWYARFYDERKERYTIVRSLGVEVRGKLQKRAAAYRKAAELLQVICFNKTKKSFVEYMLDYYNPQGEYAEYKRHVDKKPLSAKYCSQNTWRINKYIAPYFGNKKMPLIRRCDIENFLSHLGKGGMSAKQMSEILLSIKIVLKYAKKQQLIAHVPCEDIVLRGGKRQEKGVLTRAELRRLFDSPVDNPLSRLGIMLGALCGMRIGEVRGLHRSDIVAGVIHLQHNWQDGEGIKQPKCDSFRNVPLPQEVAALYYKMETPELIFESKKNKPYGICWFNKMLHTELAAIGISREEARERNITFHSLRHTFITHGRDGGINVVEMQALSGHREAHSVEHYTHEKQIMDFTKTRCKMESIFGRSA